MTIKELLELFNRSYEEFAKLTFYYYTKIQYNETKLITKREQLRCVYRNFKNQSQQIYFDSEKKLSSQSI